MNKRKTILTLLASAMLLASCISEAQRERENRRQFILDSMAISHGMLPKAERDRQAKIQEQASKSDIEKVTDKVLQQQFMLHMLPSPNK